jgi:hypothetical protein
MIPAAALVTQSERGTCERDHTGEKPLAAEVGVIGTTRAEGAGSRQPMAINDTTRVWLAMEGDLLCLKKILVG